MRNLKNILLSTALVVVVLLVPAVVFGATTVGNNVSVGGALDVTGATTLNGAVTLGDSAADSITITGKLGQIYISDGTTTSTLAKNSFIVAQAANFSVGKFYVDSSGNVSASGTLGIVGATTLTNVSSTNYSASGYLDVGGATTLNGTVTLGNATGDDITITGYIASNIIAKTNNTYDLGSFGKAFKDAYVSSTLFVGDLSDQLYIDKANGRTGVASSTPSARLSVGLTAFATTSVDFAKPCFRMTTDDGTLLYYWPTLVPGNLGGWATSTVTCF